MSKREFLILILLFIILQATIVFGAYTNVSACGSISSSGGYALNTSILGSGNCLSLDANNIELNCNGFTINYANSSNGVGITNSIFSATNNLTIKNCNIIDPTSLGSGIAISLSGANNITIINNTIRTNGSASAGIGSDSAALAEVTVTQNVIDLTSSSFNSVAISFSNGVSNASIFGNNITNDGSESKGISTSSTTSDLRVYNNNITSQQIGVLIVGSNIIISNNTIVSTSQAFDSSLLGISSAANFSRIYGNNISLNEKISAGISFSGIGSNVTSNIVQINTTSNSITRVLWVRTTNSTWTNNTATTNGGATLWAVHVFSASNNALFNNSISITGNSSSSGTGFIFQLASDNNLSGNSVSVNSNNSIGISLSGVSDNILSNNSIVSIATGSSVGISNLGFNNLTDNIVNSSFTGIVVNSSSLTLNSNMIIDYSGFALNLSVQGLENISFVDQILSNYSFYGSGSRISVENTSFGKIVFLNSVNGSGSNFFGSSSSDVYISNNSVSVDSSGSPGLNSSANITLYGIGNRGFSIPVVLIGGSVCRNCYNYTSLTASNVLFNVTGWSTYSIGATPVPAEASSGGGGSIRPYVYTITEEELVNGYNAQLRNIDKLVFPFNGNNELSIYYLNDKVLQVRINPGNSFVNLNINSTKKVDVDNDGRFDIILNYDGKIGNLVKFFIQKIPEPKVLDDANDEVIIPESVNDSFVEEPLEIPSVTDNKSSKVIIPVLVLIAVVVSIIFTLPKKKLEF